MNKSSKKLYKSRKIIKYFAKNFVKMFTKFVKCAIIIENTYRKDFLWEE